MGFVGNYAPCGLAPQIDDMPVILKKARKTLQNKKKIYFRGLTKWQTRAANPFLALKCPFLTNPFVNAILINNQDK